MNAKKMLLSLTALMLACTPLAGADVPDADGVCDGDEPANVQCEVIAGPASVTIKGVVSVGIGFCQTETTDIPLQCEGAAGDVNGVGAATFGDATWTGQKLININAVLDQGTCTDATSPPCGFTVDICNDRDQDSNCTNIGDQDDELPGTAASQGAVSACKDEKKDCANANEAGWEGCMDDSVFGDWSADQIIVFIGVEAGPTTDPDVQAAVSTGTYTVWMSDLGGCVQTTDPTPSAGCIWERDPSVDAVIGVIDAVDYVLTNGAASDPNVAAGFIVAGVTAATNTAPQSDACNDDGGNAVNFDCAGAQFLVVIHAGVGSTSAVQPTGNDCSGQDPQTASTTSPVNVQASDGSGTFQCQFTWTVAGAGACITV